MVGGLGGTFLLLECFARLIVWGGDGVFNLGTLGVERRRKGSIRGVGGRLNFSGVKHRERMDLTGKAVERVKWVLSADQLVYPRRSKRKARGVGAEGKTAGGTFGVWVGGADNGES